MYFDKWQQDDRMPAPRPSLTGSTGQLGIPVPPSQELVGTSSELYEGTDPHTTPDVAFGHHLAQTGRRLARYGDLKGLESFYLQHRGDDATIIVNGVCQNDEFSPVLEEWGLSAKRSATAQLFCGENFSWRAWEARGGRLASEVSSGQADVFITFLNEGARHINQAISLRPDDPEPYYRMIRIRLGLNGSDPEASNLLEKVRQRHKWHLLAHMATLTHKCEKWGGSHAEMFHFARTMTQNEPSGSPLWALIPQMILERSVYYTIENDYEGANKWLRNDDIVTELHNAYMKSIGSGQMGETPLTPVVLNWFACNLVYSNLKVAKETLEKVGHRVQERPWVYIDAPTYKHVNGLRKDYGLTPI